MRDHALVVDLDHSLIQTDLLHEGLVRLLRDRPLSALALPFKALQGRSRLKAWVVSQMATELDAESLPYNKSVLDKIREYQKHGCEVILASASHQNWVSKVAEYVGISRALGSDETVNLKGLNKLRKIKETLGNQQFAYIGDSMADIPIWRESQLAILVSPSGPLKEIAKSFSRVEFIEGQQSSIRIWLKQLRVHQWVKNLLVFLPALAGHKIFDFILFGKGLVAFAAFSLVASSIYILNDAFDVDSDRKNPSKKLRPIASGSVGILNAVGIGFCLMFLGLLTASFYSWPFTGSLMVYVLANWLYSGKWKKLIVLDILCLGFFYAIRVFAGSQITEVPVSHWMMTFCLFFFMGLAFVKRYAEVLLLEHKTVFSGRGYRFEDAPVILALGAGSSFTSALVLASYLNSDKVLELYIEPTFLLALPPLLIFWLCRVWILAGRRELDQDPVAFALRDRMSLLAVIMSGLIILLAQRGFSL